MASTRTNGQLYTDCYGILYQNRHIEVVIDGLGMSVLSLEEIRNHGRAESRVQDVIGIINYMSITIELAMGEKGNPQDRKLLLGILAGALS